MSGLLAEMAKTSNERAQAARNAVAFTTLRDRALARKPAPPLDLAKFDLIAEVKLRAPSAGVLAMPDDPAAEAARRAVAYAKAGAAAVSVLTEPTRFDGHLSHLLAAANACPVPVMRKDFLVDPYQVWEARAAGAGGVLLIARLLDDDALPALLDAAGEAGLWVLVEAFDERDLERADDCVAWWTSPQPILVGVNCRDLDTLAVDFGRFAALSKRLPRGAVAVAESGVSTGDEARAVAAAGYKAALVGTALMQAPDPGVLVRDLLAAGRA